MRRLMILLVRMYQRFVSPLFPPHCRFTPTCSEYAVQALGKYGVLKGGVISLKRILKCHPFHPGGDDPLR